jgi:hypothetical protein
VIFDDITSALFEKTEDLVEVRHRLSQALDSTEDPRDQCLIPMAIRQLDIVRITLLYEYELLDTSNIIQEEYLTSYFARRIEILQMTREQLLGHCRELQKMADHMGRTVGREQIERCLDIILSSQQCLDRIVKSLEQNIVLHRERHTTH